MDTVNTDILIQKIKTNDIAIKEIETQIPSPFALSLIARGYTDILRAEDRHEFIKRMHNMVLAKIGQKSK
jgi:ATP-dependent Lhr-like helicase